LPAYKKAECKGKEKDNEIEKEVKKKTRGALVKMDIDNFVTHLCLVDTVVKRKHHNSQTKIG
jgi:hypothetical protein